MTIDSHLENPQKVDLYIILGNWLESELYRWIQAAILYLCRL